MLLYLNPCDIKRDQCSVLYNFFLYNKNNNLITLPTLIDPCKFTAKIIATGFQQKSLSQI